MKERASVRTKGSAKEVRQEAILRLIENEKIATQNDLSRRLEESGFPVTQATISRDIRELRLVKVAEAGGDYHYAVGKTQEKYQASHKFYSIFLASVVKIDYANNLVVITCYTGMAQAVCACIDSLEWQGVVGTVAGDDTILMITRDEQTAAEMVKTLREIR
ncbi:MAG: arginine repressor [Lachnospiraceae bacterium]|jgi:transcriptional regulator of arginine metabolism|nr:arginine repressor [Lachnospiraceae bacterium]